MEEWSLRRKVLYLVMLLALVGGGWSVGVVLVNQKKEIVDLKNDNKVLNVKIEKHDAIEVERKNIELAIQLYSEVSRPEAEVLSYLYQLSAKRYSADWCLMEAVVKYESNHNPNMKSRSNAKGYFMFLEGTAKLECKRLGVPYKENLTVWNELVMWELAADYLMRDFKKNGAGAAIRTYISGTGYASPKLSKNAREYQDKYYNDVMREYMKLRFIYKGVCHNAKDR